MNDIEFTTPTGMTEEMKSGMAYAYSQKGFRSYLDNSINQLIVKSSEKASDWETVLYYRGAIIYMKKLRAELYREYMEINKNLEKKLIK